MINHVAFIPDGNRRWAKSRGVSIIEAYERGVAKIHEIVDYFATSRRVRYVTFYVLSLENTFSRSREELELIYALLVRELRKIREDPKTYERGVRVRVIGIREILPRCIIEEIEKTESATSKNDNCIVSLAVAYSGFLELPHMLLRKIREEGIENTITRFMDNEVDIREYTYMKDIPKPDIVVRTGGEQRISNFLLPHISSSRLVFLEKYWPDITIRDIENILNKLDEQLFKLKSCTN